MFLRQQPKINYSALNSTGYKQHAATMASNTVHEHQQFSPRPSASPHMKVTSPLATQAEIEALEAELEVLNMEEKLETLKLEVARKKNIVKGFQDPMERLANSPLLQDILPAKQTAQASGSSFEGMPSYMAFLGLGAGIGECQYFDIMQFLDAGVSGVGAAKGKCGVGKTRPDKISPDWDDCLDENISPLMWTGASIKILSRLISDGELNTDGILRYLAYMLRFTQFDISYTWKSMLLHDR